MKLMVTDKIKFYKVEAYLGNERQCLNVVCKKCLTDTLNEYKVKVLIPVKENNKCYWCDCCLEGSEHPLFEKKMLENKKRKGYI